MNESADLLRLRVLLCFLRSTPENCNVTGISRTLREEKYTISRMMAHLERDGLVDRTDNRRPILTEAGLALAERYAERSEIAINHLLYEGVDMENAIRDASYWALYCSDKLMEIVRESDERCRVKHELKDMKSFNGAELCKRLKDGAYQFPFIINREQVKNHSNLSMANEGFAHPCTLLVKNGKGWIQLRAVPITAKSGSSGEVMQGRVHMVEYFDVGRYVSAALRGNVISIPAEVLNFVNIGEGVGQVLHGSVPLRMNCSVGTLHMPESQAIFTILI